MVQHRELNWVFWDALEGWNGGWGQGAQEGGNICIRRADSHCYTAEINTTL